MATVPRTRKGPGSRWLAAQGWKAFPFQREVARPSPPANPVCCTPPLARARPMRSGWPPWMPSSRPGRSPPRACPASANRRHAAHRALADAPCAPWRRTPARPGAAGARRRTGMDSGPAHRRYRQQRARPAESPPCPTALVTTPESLSLLLSREDAQEALGQVRLVVIDEWHELLGNKRGTQTQLALARLRRWNPGLQTWGLSATLGNQAHALDVLLAVPRASSSRVVRTSACRWTPCCPKAASNASPGPGTWACGCCSR